MSIVKVKKEDVLNIINGILDKKYTNGCENHITVYYEEKYIAIYFQDKDENYKLTHIACSDPSHVVINGIHRKIHDFIQKHKSFLKKKRICGDCKGTCWLDVDSEEAKKYISLALATGMYKGIFLNTDITKEL